MKVIVCVPYVVETNDIEDDKVKETINDIENDDYVPEEDLSYTKAVIMNYAIGNVPPKPPFILLPEQLQTEPIIEELT